MDVRRPAAVLRGSTDARKLFSPRNALGNSKTAESVLCQMTVEREEFLSLASLVPQNHQRSVVQRSRVIRKDVDHAVQRRAKRRAGLHKQIYPEMNCPPLVRRIAARAEQPRSVNQPRLVIPSNPGRRVGAFYLMKYFLRDRWRYRSTRIGAEKRAADAQVKHHGRRSPRIAFQYR